MTDRTALFRAVMPAELEDIKVYRRFRNPPQTHYKYFALEPEGATQYARLARDRFAVGPFTLVETSIPKSAISWEMRARVDGGIETLAIRTPWLSLLTTTMLLV